MVERDRPSGRPDWQPTTAQRLPTSSSAVSDRVVGGTAKPPRGGGSGVLPVGLGWSPTSWRTRGSR